MTTVRQIIEDIIGQYPDYAEIDIEAIEDLHPGKFDRTDILNSFKQLEIESKGVLLMGRRNKRTRFVKGAKRVEHKVNDKYMAALTEAVTNMENGKEMTVDEALVYFDNNEKNRTETIEALKVLQIKALGVFVIGRRGGVSRFVRGVNKNELAAKSKTIIIPNNVSSGPFSDSAAQTTIVDVPAANIKYNIVNNVIFKTVDVQAGYNDIESAISAFGISTENIEDIKENLMTFGFYNLSAVSINDNSEEVQDTDSMESIDSEQDSIIDEEENPNGFMEAANS